MIEKLIWGIEARMDELKRQERERRIKQILDNSRKAGFSEQEITLERADNLAGCFDRSHYPEARLVSPENLRLFNLILPPGPLRTQCFRDEFHAMDLLRLLSDIDGANVGKNHGIGLKLASEFGAVGQSLLTVEGENPWWHNQIFVNLRTICGVVGHPWIYQQLGHDPSRLIAIINAHGSGHLYSLKCFFENISTLPHREKVIKFLNDLGGEIFDECFASGKLYWFIERPPEYFDIYARYLRSEQNWADAIVALDRSFALIGIGGFTNQQLNLKLLQSYVRSEAQAAGTDQYQQRAGEVARRINDLTRGQKFNLLCQLRQALGDEQLLRLRERLSGENRAGKHSDYRNWLDERLKRARFKEDRRHPLNSLGIARLVGYEIEYPSSDLLLKKTGPDFFAAIAALGFKWGTEIYDCHETSPDPVSDPETAITIFQMYCQAGIIDLYRYAGMTQHFNVGLESDDGLNFLTWSLYLTAAAYDPEYSDKYWGMDFKVFKKKSNFGAYIEGKLFDVMTAHGFEWNFKAASYLSWALAAYQEATQINGNKPGYKKLMALDISPYKKTLAAIWLDYVQEIKAGLKSVSLGLSPDTWDVDESRVKRLDTQIKLVYPDAASRYEDPHSVTELTRLVTCGDRQWPNIVAFATDVIDETVAKIMKVAFQVESDTVLAIQEIDAAGGTAKMDLINKFTQNLNVALPTESTPEDKVKAFEEVKGLFIGYSPIEK